MVKTMESKKNTMQKEQDNIGRFKIAQALSQDYFVIYYVDFETGHYMEYDCRTKDHSLRLRKTGDDFFGDSSRIIKNLVMPDDQERLFLSMDKENLLNVMEEGIPFTITYRRMLKGVPRYVHLKAHKIGDDSSQIVICLSDIDTKTKKEKDYQTTKKENLIFSRIAQTLARDYFQIFYVNTLTNDYIEFDATDKGDELKMTRQKGNFFEVFRHYLMDKTYGAERYEAWTVWGKEAVLKALHKDNSFSSIHRMLLHGETVYVNIKAMQMINDDQHHIVVGMSNINEQMKHEQEFFVAQQLAVIDPLTGVKNKRAYTQAEQGIDESIRKRIAEPFAIVLCDVNNLKQINDNLGHAAGDVYIKEACREICDIFKHSPVYRVGGDEFAVVLTGHDYENRIGLLSRLEAVNIRNSACDKVVIAGGIAEYQPDKDKTVSNVFARADHEMYINKKRLKEEKDDDHSDINWIASP